MLCDVAGPRSLEEAFSESSGVASGAGVFADAGKHVEQALVELHRVAEGSHVRRIVKTLHRRKVVKEGIACAD